MPPSVGDQEGDVRPTSHRSGPRKRGWVRRWIHGSQADLSPGSMWGMSGRCGWAMYLARRAKSQTGILLFNANNFYEPIGLPPSTSPLFADPLALIVGKGMSELVVGVEAPCESLPRLPGMPSKLLLQNPMRRIATSVTTAICADPHATEMARPSSLR